MQALYVSAPGVQPVLGELDTPTPAEGQVLVRVRAAGLNPIDNVLAAGHMAQHLPHAYPLVLGRDVAGTVEAMGPGVDAVRLGDEVLGCLPLRPPIQAGTIAEFVLVPADAVAALPEGLDHVTAAAIPMAGAAATATIDATALAAGEIVLVNGATGGVGLFALQLAVARGATVIATGTADDVDRLHALGAAEVVDFTAGDVAAQVLQAHPAGVDVLINLVGQTPEQIPFAALRPGARVASTTYGATDDALAKAGVTGAIISANPTAEVTAPLAALAASGELTVDIEQVLPIDRALDGLAALAAGTARGKTVIAIGQ